METKETYVLIKRDLFWCPNSQGYTGALSNAGDYSADDISGRPLLDAYDPKHEWEETYALLKSAAPELTKACCVYVQRDALKAERDAALSVQKQLVEAMEYSLTPYDGWSEAELMRRVDPATRSRIERSAPQSWLQRRRHDLSTNRNGRRV